MRIDVTFDLVCPWCYLALASLEEAVAGKPENAVHLWPFQLTPEVPSEGVDFAAFFAARVGEVRAKERQRYIEALAVQAGLPLDYSRVEVLPNTMLAHRVVLFAQVHGKGLAVATALMKAHFTGSKIGKIDVAVAIAEGVGVDGERLRDNLEDSSEQDGAKRLMHRAISLGVRTVPHVELDGVPSPGGRTVEQWEMRLPA